MSVTSGYENRLMDELDSLMKKQENCKDKQKNNELNIKIQKVWDKIDKLDEWVYGCLNDRGIFR